MFWEHVAAIIFFSGPIFYIGLLIVMFPTEIAKVPEWLAQAIRNFANALGGHPSPSPVAEPGPTGISRTTRKRLRLAGLAVLLIGLVFPILM
jgi:hypothetical protein